MIRILQCVNDMNRAGLETMLMNYYRHIDRNIVQFDFLTHRSERADYDDEIEFLGGTIYRAPRLYPQNYPLYFRQMDKFFSEHKEYLVVHSHIDTMSYFPLRAAKKADVPVRIGHSHNTRLDYDFKYPIKYFALTQMPKVANIYCGCGQAAGEFMYPNKEFKIIHNAINLEKYSFDEDKRKLKRKELGIGDEYVVGHVGRYRYVKNQMFIIDIFVEILKNKPNSILLLIGAGEDEEKLRQRAKELCLEDKIKFLVNRSDVDELYQVMDAFVMPSIFEGLPVVLVEAQANGLPCLISTNISPESMIASNIISLSLKESAKTWADKLLSMDSSRNVNAKKQLQDAGYDIQIESKKLQDWYVELYSNAKNNK